MTTTHRTATREEWLVERLDLLAAEKELTRRGDELARRRQELPWVRIDKDYASTPTMARPPSRTCSRGGHSSWSITSCMGRTTRRDAPPVLRSPTASTAFPSI